MKKTVLAFGEVLWDILPAETVLGGAVCNFIYRVNSLGDNGIIVSRLGKDELGEAAFKRVAALGLGTEYLQWDDHHPTGTVPVTFDEDGNHDFTIIPNVAYDYIEMTNAFREVIPTVDCLCFGTVAQRSAKTRQTLKQLVELAGNSLKLLDINLRKDCYNIDTITYSLETADILKLNEDELHEIAEMFDLAGDDALQICQNVMEKWSFQCCVVTLAEKGAFALSEKGEKVYTPGYKVELEDSVGSGDAFTAGFAYCTLREMSLTEACELGNVLGAIVSTQKGATAPVTWDEVAAFRGRKTERIYHREIEKLAKN